MRLTSTCSLAAHFHTNLKSPWCGTEHNTSHACFVDFADVESAGIGARLQAAVLADKHAAGGACAHLLSNFDPNAAPKSFCRPPGDGLTCRSKVILPRIIALCVCDPQGICSHAHTHTHTHTTLTRSMRARHPRLHRRALQSVRLSLEQLAEELAAASHLHSGGLADNAFALQLHDHRSGARD